jgi:hypothetical protein
MQKRVKKAAAFIFGACYVASSLLFAQSASAQKSIMVSQSILPVRIAYVDEHNKISGFWSNVSMFDSAYVVKFYKQNSTEEIESDSLLIREFAREYKDSENKTSLQNFNVANKQARSVEVVLKSGSIVQEVETVV